MSCCERKRGKIKKSNLQRRTTKQVGKKEKRNLKI